MWPYYTLPSIYWKYVHRTTSYTLPVIYYSTVIASLVTLLTFLSIKSTFVLEARFSGRLLVYPWALTVHLLLADLFLHTFEYDFMVKTMKQDITKAIQFSNTFRYIDDLFSINNLNFGNCISVIYPSELELKHTSTSSTEVCYLDTNIKTGVKTQKKVSTAKFSKRREAMRDGCISRLYRVRQNVS